MTEDSRLRLMASACQGGRVSVFRCHEVKGKNQRAGVSLRPVGPTARREERRKGFFCGSGFLAAILRFERLERPWPITHNLLPMRNDKGEGRIADCARPPRLSCSRWRAGISDFGLKIIKCKSKTQFGFHNPHSAFPNPRTRSWSLSSIFLRKTAKNFVWLCYPVFME